MVKIEDTTEEVKRAITGKDYGILVEVSTREGLRSTRSNPFHRLFVGISYSYFAI